MYNLKPRSHAATSREDAATLAPTAASATQQCPTPGSSRTNNVRCAFCFRRGHVALECRKRLGQLAAVPPSSSSSSALVAQTATNSAAASSSFVAGNDLSQLDPSVSSSEFKQDSSLSSFSYVFLTSVDKHMDAWVLDSGATSSATFDEKDCVDIRSCEVHVTAAGSQFTVTKIGTAVVTALDEQGRQVKLSFCNCLISPLFPCKLVSMSSLTKKGVTVHMTQDKMRLTNPVNDVVLLGLRDSASQLFVLQEAKKARAADAAVPSTTSTTSASMLAKSYQVGKGSDLDLLWKLHLRHGHRNFADLARQYHVPVPKQTPSCTSCVMGKAHLQPKLSSGFDRASRKAEGFHSDFRGPFTVPTPEGYLYLLTIVDDYTRRIFGFLAKSQAEWMDIFAKFVLRVEAELGKPNCISWILTDNGAVYKSAAMSSFCSARGIQQRFSGAYSQWMNHTAERNMRTIGEMMTTTMIHANLPRRAWGYAALLAIDVINRTADSVQPNFKNTMSRLERWKGKELPGQTKGLYPLGCLAFKLVPPQLRTKLDAHASPHVYLGIDPKSRSYLLGSLFDLKLSVTVEATFLEHVFPFRQHKSEDSPASLLWGTESFKLEGDPRLGMFESGASFAQDDAPFPIKNVDLKTLKAIYSAGAATGTSPHCHKTPRSSLLVSHLRLRRPTLWHLSPSPCSILTRNNTTHPSSC